MLLTTNIHHSLPLLPVASVVVGSAVSLYSRVAKHAQKAVSAHWIRRTCANLAARWGDLWTQVQSDEIDQQRALAVNEDLNREL